MGLGPRQKEILEALEASQKPLPPAALNQELKNGPMDPGNLSRALKGLCEDGFVEVLDDKDGLSKNDKRTKENICHHFEGPWAD